MPHSIFSNASGNQDNTTFRQSRNSSSSSFSLLTPSSIPGSFLGDDLYSQLESAEELDIDSSSIRSIPSYQSLSDAPCEPINTPNITMPGRKRTQFSNLEQMESRERVQLFDTIDKFRELNISEDISLPQLVVVGDQSSGKSSLLEGLTEISFPVASELCTRFATQIVLRRTEDEEGQVRATIIPGIDADEDTKDRLQAFDVSMTEAEFGSANFEKILDDAAEAMGIPKPGTVMEDTPPKRFSNDILKIELSARHHPHLTVVDVPGLFHNSTKHQTEEDRELIRNLIKAYIEDPRTIIMAVMDGRNNLANQEVFNMARKVDPEGNRTVGIITKCDAVQPGDEHGVIQIASNKMERLRHGWFVVKNRSTKEINDGVTIAERHVREKEFFKKAPWNRLNKEHVGIEKLKPFLGHLLYQHVRNEFPKLVDEINKLVLDTENQLESLGDARTSATEQRMYLTRIANDYERRVTDCLDAKLREVVPLNSPLKIRTHLQNMNDDFGRRMKALGHTRKFKDINGNDDYNGYDRELRKKLDEEVNDPKDIYDWIRQTYRNSRGPELPGLVNPNVVVEMFREQATNWRDLSRKYLSSVADIINKFNIELFNKVITDETVRKRLTIALSKESIKAINEAFRNLDQLVEDECNGILQTVNDAFAHTLSTTRQERVLARLNIIKSTQEGQEGGFQFDVHAIMSALILSNEDSAVYDIHDTLKSYYSISLKRFTDNVIVQIIESQLLGKKGPIRLFKSEYISGLQESELGGIAREDWQVASTRRELQSRLERARSAQEAASMVSV